jgi:hypothetical protein
MREWQPEPQQFASFRAASAKTPLSPIVTSQFHQISYQVSDSGCVVTVRDTGVASLAPRTRIRETDGSRRTGMNLSFHPSSSNKLISHLAFL